MSLICFVLLISSPTIEQTNFENTIHQNYDCYYYEVKEETSIGDIVIVIGIINDKMYVSGFIYNTTNTKHIFKLSNGNTYSSLFYKVKLEKEFSVSIVTESGNVFKTYKLENTTSSEFSQINVIVGEGENNFPKEKIVLDIFDIFTISAIVFVGLIALLTVVIVIMYRKRIGRFNETYQKDNSWQLNNYNNGTIIDVQEQDYYLEEEPEKSKEEQMREAYDEFKNGKITEVELNNRLRRIWWSEDD